MSSTAQPDKAKSGRSATSCLECQRRKQKCSREWPCNHCQARKVPHLCRFAAKKVTTPERDSSLGPLRQDRKRKEDSSMTDSSALADDPIHGLCDGLAKLGYMPGHEVFSLARSSTDCPNGRGLDSQCGQSDEIEAALKVILPKPYTDILVQNYLERANYQYYPIFPEQLRGQCAQWWEARAAGRRLSPELTCLLLRVCAVSAQYLEESLRQRLEVELGEKAQCMTERFDAAAKKLSASIPRGQGGVIQVQQLFLEAAWWKSEASMIDSWHSLSGAIREAQEIGMHKPIEGIPNFERELRKRLWCILWTWDWQMSTLLSRPLLIDQGDHKLEIPDGRLENASDPEIPHPLSSVALQAQLGLHVSHLFQKMGTDSSVELVLEIEDALEEWMGTFPAALRDHRPDTRWDKEHPHVPYMRCQVNIIAYCYLLAPLKSYLLGTADPKTMNSQLGSELRLKGVDTCLDLMSAAEKFYDLIFPTSIKYFFIIFFMFDAATVMCSAIAHDTAFNLPKRAQCVRALRTAQELMDDVAHISEAARISAQLLRKLCATLTLTEAEKQILGVRQATAHAKKIRTGDASDGPALDGVTMNPGYNFSSIARTEVSYSLSVPSTGNSNTPLVVDSGPPPPYEMVQQQPQQQQQQQQQAPPPRPQQDFSFDPQYAAVAASIPMSAMPPQPLVTSGDWHLGYTAGLTATVTGDGMLQQQQQQQQQAFSMQPGGPLTGTFLEPLWDWDHLNLDLSGYNIPQTQFPS